MDLLEWSSVTQNLPIIGLDEAGRGCLCGPVYAAAVCFKPQEASASVTNSLYKDSKTLSEKKRETLFAEILSLHSVGVGWANAKEVDQVNILQASFLAMKRALMKLNFNPNSCHVLIDGNQLLPDFSDFSQSFVIKGDQKIPEISAASIIAKVSRDRYLKEIDAKYPEYGFSKHKGYGTKEHRNKIQEHGPCPEHRLTFKGVREFYKASAQ